MNRLFLGSVLTLALAMGGCADHALCAKSVRSYWGPLKGDYQRYLDNDPELQKPEKAKDRKYRQDAIQGMDDTLKIMEGGK